MLHMHMNRKNTNNLNIAVYYTKHMPFHHFVPLL